MNNLFTPFKISYIIVNDSNPKGRRDILDRKVSKQLRVFEEELQVIFAKASKDNTSVQIALSNIIKEWEKYDTDHQSKRQQ